MSGGAGFRGIPLIWGQHGQHHAATGHLTRDQVFVPRTRKEKGFPAINDDAEIQSTRYAVRTRFSNYR